MKNTLILFIFLLISSAQTCAAQDAPKVAAQEYESCCGTQPVEFSYEKKRIYVPNVFTPNRDGVNDYFFPRQLLGKSIGAFSMQVFNRWGEKVYETTDPLNGWDGTYHGKEVNAGVFVYFMTATFENGTTVEKRGNISLIR